MPENGTTHLPPATARPHHRCVGDTTLAIRVPERVQYKIAVLTYMYKVLHDSAPRYLGPLVAVADLLGRRALPSASTSRLAIPPIKLSTVGSRAFPVAAAQVWNGLPEAVISSSSLQTFRRQLFRPHLEIYVYLLTYLPIPVLTEGDVE